MVLLQSWTSIYRGLSWCVSSRYCRRRRGSTPGHSSRASCIQTRMLPHIHTKLEYRLHYSRIMLEHVENAMQLLPLSNQCTYRSSIQSITLQRKQSTKQHLHSLLHESNTTFKHQYTHFINHGICILEYIAHHSYSLK